MVDTLSRDQRSYCMSRISSVNTAPEIRLRKALWHAGLRYRLKNSLPGRPDIIFPSAMLAVFVDGCFWHGCPKHAVRPKSNIGYWHTKLAVNRRRDREVNNLLERRGWAVLRIWEHETKDDIDQCVRRITKQLQSGYRMCL